LIGRFAATVVRVFEVTTSCMLSRETVGAVVPKPCPVIVILQIAIRLWNDFSRAAAFRTFFAASGLFIGAAAEASVAITSAIAYYPQQTVPGSARN
jgi:hypothetical protein